MDWTGCELVEVIPGKVSGVPLVKGTRVPADFVLENFELGYSVEEIHAEFPRISNGKIEGLLAFARMHEADAA